MCLRSADAKTANQRAVQIAQRTKKKKNRFELWLIPGKMSSLNNEVFTQFLTVYDIGKPILWGSVRECVQKTEHVLSWRHSYLRGDSVDVHHKNSYREGRLEILLGRLAQTYCVYARGEDSWGGLAGSWGKILLSWDLSDLDCCKC